MAYYSDRPAVEDLQKRLGSKFTRAEFDPYTEDVDLVMMLPGGIKVFFEVKQTFTNKSKCFGAATLSEWRKAMENPNRFYFVIAKGKKEGENIKPEAFMYEFLTPEEFMKESTMPPYKIYFNHDLQDAKSKGLEDLELKYNQWKDASTEQCNLPQWSKESIKINKELLCILCEEYAKHKQLY